MKLIKLLPILLVLFLFSCSENEKSENIIIIEASNKMASLRDGNSYAENSWTISPDINPDIWYVEVAKNKKTKATFITDKDSISFNIKANETKDFIVVLNKKDTAYTQLKAVPKAASFSKGYIKKNKGKYTVDNPETHELVNIMVALTKSGRLDSNMVYMETKYYKDVMQHFDKFSDHAIIDTLNTHITGVFDQDSYWYYYNIRMNGNMYNFDANNKIVNKSPYMRLGFDIENYLEPLLPLVNDFAVKSSFRNFYAKHKDYHDSLIEEYYKLADINKMWKWVESKFPQRYESYKIYFSPLIGGAHSTQRFTEDNFKETIMFVNAPTYSDAYSDEEKEAISARIVFTEIDHNYVNPTTDKYPEINNLLDPLDCWNAGKQGYGVSYATFNEYMTWAVFSLYLKDNFDDETFKKRNKADAGVMARGRGFIKFEAFNDFVLEWYENNKEKSLTELYPAAINWFKNQECSSVK